MSRWWAVPMLLGGGLFAGGLVVIAWERVPAWQADLVAFRTGFAHTLERVDRLQPALLVVCAGSAVGFGSSTSGGARTLALLAAGGFLAVLVGSLAVLVPIQRRLVAAGSPPPSLLLQGLGSSGATRGAHMRYALQPCAAFFSMPDDRRPAAGACRRGGRGGFQR